MMGDNKMELVIVDDDDLIFELFNRMLKNDDCKVSGFTNQEECLAYLSNTQPTFLFVDMRMPRIDGLEFLMILQKQGISKVTKIFLCTGLSPTDRIRVLMSAMGVEIVEKETVCNKARLRSILEFNDCPPLD
jgi:CheY-like chemotaxis protein